MNSEMTARPLAPKLELLGDNASLESAGCCAALSGRSSNSDSAAAARPAPVFAIASRRVNGGAMRPKWHESFGPRKVSMPSFDEEEFVGIEQA
jgi:hypothetical protein